VNDVLSEVRHGLDLVNSHLQLSRLEQRGSFPVTVKLDVARFLTEELQPYRRVARSQGVAIQLNVPEAGCAAYVDADKLRIAINPLLENALRFSPEGSAITITVVQEPGRIGVRISDAGPGMTSAGRDAASGTRQATAGRATARARSTGLGLSIARRAAELHGGTLLIESGGGQGLAVTVMFQEYAQDRG